MTSISNERSEVECFVVPDDCIGLRLDVVLCRLVEFVPSRSFAKRLIECNAVTVSGKPRRPSWNLQDGEVIEVDVAALRPPPLELQPQKIDFPILFEDEHILVLDKPAGLVVHPGAGVPDGTLVNAVLAHTGATLPTLGDPLRAGLVHRLDRDTSGVMVIAKSQLALTELSRQFASHTQKRIYRALIFGSLSPDIQTVETWHGRDPRNRLKYAVLPEGQGKRARMIVRQDRVFVGGLAAAVSCELFTGRTHQIRVQLSHLKHGLLGDSLYGPSAQNPLSGTVPLMRDKALWPRVRELASRQMLHAEVLGLTHPHTQQTLTFRTDPPQDFKILENFLADCVLK